MTPVSNVIKHHGEVNRIDREKQNKHRAKVFWFTGLSGSGKSTIAHAVEKTLFNHGIRVYVFDGDNVRHGLCSDLGFSQQDRTENTRRIGEVAKLFVDSGTICLCAFITPMEQDRQAVRDILGDDYNEIYVSCPLEVCEARDVKGYYKQARAGEIANYTGVNAPYHAPENPDLLVDSDRETLEESVAKVLQFIESNI